MPLDFLSSILHAFKRSDQVAERCLARMAEDWESQERAKVEKTRYRMSSRRFRCCF